MKTLMNKPTARPIAWMDNAAALRPLIIALLMLVAVVSSASAQSTSPLTLGDKNHSIHVLAPNGRQANRENPSADTLLYHGGPVMHSVTTYAIFWLPQSGLLQDGLTKTTLPIHYRTVLQDLLRSYPGHGIANNNTQYYELVNPCLAYVGGGGGIGIGQDLSANDPCDPVPYYIQNSGGLGGVYIERSSYPAPGPDCGTDPNCITDTQLQTEIQNVMAQKQWSGGLNTMFFVFTSTGEDSCATFGSITGCSYSFYCAYHGSFQAAKSTVVYANEPYLDPTLCPLGTVPSPNNDPAADVAADAATHELTEAITDPLVLTAPAWQAADGEEIGDLCQSNFGSNGWDNGNANQMWDGFFFEVQTMYDNYAAGCAQVGP